MIREARIICMIELVPRPHSQIGRKDICTVGNRGLLTEVHIIYSLIIPLRSILLLLSEYEKYM